MKSLDELLNDHRQKQEELITKLRSLLEKLDHATLYSLNYHNRKPKTPNKKKSYFHDFEVVGSVKLDFQQSRTVFSNLILGLEQESNAFMCFYPRHGIAAHFGERVIDFVMCFECGLSYVYDGQDATDCSTGPSPQLVLSPLLISQGIRIVK